MLVGNKADKQVEREVSQQEGAALAKDLGCDFIESSAKTCYNVEKAFYDVVRTIRCRRQGLMNTARRRDRKKKCAIM
ncbi:Protein ras-2 [Neolecta irregularis DAH-3]|uniref:small monomeric GTPase n=1 Tax=Neolecta irregularis (strain DAH-3) TaxID=1198029 RepID=A0A1U7LN52_NEOID|nr:Protein ras-2 [Neolecta irregularis DAH-3]|eukprot:OLL24085.1 Protein ras-2 [Neolecta irregularis DAH-3]